MAILQATGLNFVEYFRSGANKLDFLIVVPAKYLMLKCKG